MRFFLDSLNLGTLAYLLNLLFFFHKSFTIVKGVQLEWADQLLGKKIFVFVAMEWSFATDNKVK
jgi:hypothetical protein